MADNRLNKGIKFEVKVQMQKSLDEIDEKGATKERLKYVNLPILLNLLEQIQVT